MITEPVPPEHGPGCPLDPAARGALRSRRRPRIELRLRLSTLLGLDRHPAELVATGVGAQPLPAAVATLLAGHYRRGRWRLVLTDDHGHLTAASTTRARPTDPAPLVGAARICCGPRPADGIGPWLVGRPGHAVVEIQVPRALLADLDVAAHPEAAALITAAHRLAARGPAPPTTSTDRRRRHPDAALEDSIRARDRVCVFPGCSEPALLADIDHTRDHALGGDTVERNLGAFCRADHHAKHRGRWTVRQPQPGTFLWTGPTGRTYRRVRRPLLADPPHPPEPGGPSSRRPRLAYEPRWQPGDDATTISDGPPVVDPPPPSRPPPPHRGPGILSHLRRSARALTTPDDPDDPPPF